MEKIWFALINSRKEGPFSLQELRHHPQITPDTLVWKEGFVRWMPIRKVPELKEIFIDPISNEELSEKEKKEALDVVRHKGKDELAIDINNEPPTFIFWVLITLMLVVYLMYKLYQSS